MKRTATVRSFITSYVCDYQLESACKDAPSIAPSTLDANDVAGRTVYRMFLVSLTYPVFFVRYKVEKL